MGFPMKKAVNLIKKSVSIDSDDETFAANQLN